MPSSEVRLEGDTRLPLKRHSSQSPTMRSRRTGWFIAPRTGSPFFISAISVPNSGTALIKDFVPSIGSSTQTYSAPSPEFPYSSPIIPWSGNFLEIASRSMHSTFLSTSVTGEESFLKSTLCRFPKDFAMYSPLCSASSLIKTLKDCVCMGVM